MQEPDNKTYNQASPIVYNLSDYNFTSLRDSTADFVDYDTDGDLDIFITGLDTDGAKTILYEVNSENKINTSISNIRNWNWRFGIWKS